MTHADHSALEAARALLNAGFQPEAEAVLRRAGTAPRRVAATLKAGGTEAALEQIHAMIGERA